MTRVARIAVHGLPHHIIQRGNRRQQTFFCDEDYGWGPYSPRLFSRASQPAALNFSILAGSEGYFV
jgi:hypothetical protein